MQTTYPDGKQRPFNFHWEKQLRSNTQLLGINISTRVIRRDCRKRAWLPRRDAHLTREWPEFKFLGDRTRLPLPRVRVSLLQIPDTQRRLGELVVQKSETWDERGPAPIGRGDRYDFDL